MFEDLFVKKVRVGWVSMHQTFIDDVCDGKYENLFNDLSPIRHIVDNDVWHILVEWLAFDLVAEESDDLEYPAYKLWLMTDYSNKIKLDRIEKLGIFGSVYNI